MPTGYTAKLVDEGQTFNEFVLTCARAFGACITLRDDPLSADIPKFEPTDYHKKAINSAIRKKDRLEAMTPAQASRYGMNEREKEIKSIKNTLKKANLQNDRIYKMLKAVRGWTPPTEEHDGLKTFMIEQLEMSLDDMNYWNGRLAEINDKSELSYYTDALALAKRDILYHIEENRKEIERVNGRNKWVEDLKASLQGK